MKILARRLSAFAVALGFSVSVWSHDLTGQWDLKIENKSHHVVTALVIEFTNQGAQSCIAGNWTRVKVVSAVSEDAHFYPASDALSYQLENDELTIGRNEVCDGYLMLNGPFNGETARGDYYGLAIGGTWPLGFFTLNRRK
jgi:hypothetical protein